MKKTDNISQPTNGAESAITTETPYTMRVKIRGSADLLFHRWNCEAIEENAKAPKGGKAKKFDDVDTYLWRDDAGYICLPGEYLRMSTCWAAKSIQDPRSPRKSGMDLFKAALVPITHLASLGVKNPDYLDKRRVTIQRAGINRTRPAIKAGWEATIDLMVLAPEYIDQDCLYGRIAEAGRLVGVGDFRPTFGRFNIVGYEQVT